MDRWGSALTVLLEKEFSISMLRRWLNKLAYNNGMVPVEQFARHGTQASSGVVIP
jgi:hypothetical protein